ncbi:MAG: response regulator [Campylobacterota bacterium]|nr:response regulator [Campylobacterota bacterium]
MLDNSHFRVLIVDDERFNIDVVVGFLESESYRLSFVTNGQDALNAAFSNPFDLILLDINMPGMNGFEVCERLKQDSATKEIPIIFLSALNDIETITRAFSNGAADYISKPFNGLELIARVKIQINLRRYILELIDKQTRLAQLAATDTLTGLPNRLRFLSMLNKIIDEDPSNLCMAYVKIDHLHRLNTMYGYKTCDKLIAKIAKIIRGNTRNSDTVARIFGSEFVILLPKTSLQMTVELIKSLQDILRKSKIIDTQVSFSIGLAQYQENESSEAFILRTEKIMEEAIELGGDMITNKLSS